MSHDRGCWKCGRDIWEYANCPSLYCAKENVVKEFFSGKPYSNDPIVSHYMKPKPKVRVKAGSKKI